MSTEINKMEHFHIMFEKQPVLHMFVQLQVSLGACFLESIIKFTITEFL